MVLIFLTIDFRSFETIAGFHIFETNDDIDIFRITKGFHICKAIYGFHIFETIDFFNILRPSILSIYLKVSLYRYISFKIIDFF